MLNKKIIEQLEDIKRKNERAARLAERDREGTGQRDEFNNIYGRNQIEEHACGGAESV